MSEGNKDPAIKLFGKTIPLSASEEVAVDGGEHSSDGKVLSSSDMGVHKNALTDATNQEDQTSQTTLEELKDAAANSSANSDSLKTPSGDNECKGSKEDQSDTSSSQDKPLKKPDKILPCPRCNSLDTKFCYFNNYNVNQPRHFCKNCQRYWTAGGTMRNVPVGAGRRKNKNSSASQHHRHIVIPEAVFQAPPRPDAVNGIIHHPAFRANGAVLAFGSDVPLCESIASGLNLADKSQNLGAVSNGSAMPENMVNQSSGSSTSSSDKGGNGGGVQQDQPIMKNFAFFPPQFPPWPYSLNTVQSSSPVPPTPYLPSGFPLSFYAASPYWGCLVPGAWNMPLVTPVSISPDQSCTSSSPHSPTLGKHTREGNMCNLPKSNREEAPPKDSRSDSGTKVLVPKTLRIHDPSEAAKSSIWTTLGIQNNEKGDSLDSRGLFRAFQVPRSSDADKSLVMQANPAALSRSMTFQESAA
ncbi:hypothetical protein Dimus_014905 [Dionaea muscipula]